MDIREKAKANVLQQLMDMMDERMVNDLKSRSPKFAKVDIMSDDPKLAESLKDKLVNGIKEDQTEDPTKEMTPADFKEDKAEGEDPMNEMDHKSPEEDADMERLFELYRKLK